MGVKKEKLQPVETIHKAELAKELNDWLKEGKLWLEAAKKNGNVSEIEAMAEGGIKVIRSLAKKFDIQLEE